MTARRVTRAYLRPMAHIERQNVLVKSGYCDRRLGLAVTCFYGRASLMSRMTRMMVATAHLVRAVCLSVKQRVNCRHERKHRKQ